MPAAIRAVGAAIAAVLVLASCQSGGGDGSKPATPKPASPKPGSTQVKALAFVPPKTLHKVEDKTKMRNPKATLELVGTTKSKATSPTLDVFVENGQVGSIDVRAASIVDMMKAQLPEAKIERNEKVKVPGALDAKVIEVTFKCLIDRQKEKYVACRQVEVLVQMPDAPQYGIRYGMPESDYTKTSVDALVSSVRITAN